MSSYQFDRDTFGVHQKIIECIAANKSILEIGCGSGYLLRELQKKGCRITGIEIDPVAAEKAKVVGLKIIAGDIEEEKTLGLVGREKFNTIILADVLEHLRDPESVLGKLVKYLKDNGQIIISVPNIGFLTSRLRLMLGQFDYSDWGIMDRTHLRFFTKDTISTLVKNSGLKVERFDYIANFTQLPLYMQTLYPIFGKKDWWRRLEYKITGFWPAGLAVQFLLICRPFDKLRARPFDCVSHRTVQGFA